MNPAEIVAEAMWKHDCTDAKIATLGALVDQETDVVAAYYVATEHVIKALAEAGYVIRPKIATPRMLARVLPMIEAPTAEDIASGKAAVALLPPVSRVRRADGEQAAADLARDYRMLMLDAADTAGTGGANG